MENLTPRIQTGNQIPSFKTMLMFSRTTLTRVLIIGFMVGVGYALAKAFYHQSIMGILFGFTSLGAGIYFLLLLAKAKEEMESGQNG